MSIVKSEAMKFVRLRSFLQHFGEEQLRLAHHRGLQHVVELGVEDVAGDREVDVAQAEPLAGEVLGERAATSGACSIRSTCARSMAGSRQLAAVRRARAVRRRASCSRGNRRAGWRARSRRACRAVRAGTGTPAMPSPRGRPTRTACSNEYFSASCASTSARIRLEFRIGHRPPEGAAREVARGCVRASASGCVRHDFDAVAAL